ncbi:uncharacterized protein LOC117397126 [Acipenser ruthenus]|uniref:uncharacterized protein LOC117397126 n=1 Tax=Acipenser ruthenus TaxID=7906 RepID=UPI002741B02A|nr:uncharacterized protein LOC117397126 [Acipenser ruthenus]
MNMWAEEDSPFFVEACLQSYAEPVEGKLYTMYHGTTKERAESIKRCGFRQSPDGMLGQGVYVSRDFNKASRYPLNRPDKERRVLKLRVNVGKVKKIDRQGHPMQKTWHDYGYDTAWVPPGCGMVSSGLEEDCIWDPNRIKVMEVMKPKNESSPQMPKFGYAAYRIHSTARFQAITAVSMWAEEDDSYFYEAPCLESYAQLQEWKCYTMYHGTTKERAESITRYGFQQSEDGMLGRGVYVSRDFNKASWYPLHRPEREKRVLKLCVNVGRVKKIDRQGHPMQKTWHHHGYDSAWVPPNCGMVPSGLEEDCIWDPNRITVVEVIKPKNQGSVPRFDYSAYMSPLHCHGFETTPAMNLWAEEKSRGFVEKHLQSQVLPTEGKIYVMYHGTTVQAAASIKKYGFRQSTDGPLGRGVYLSRDKNKASCYPPGLPDSKKVVLKVRVNFGRVIKIDVASGHPLQKSWLDSGYHSAFISPSCSCRLVQSGLEEYCVWDPNRIKIVEVTRP